MSTPPPPFVVPLSPPEIRTRLEGLAKRGKLAGFRALDGTRHEAVAYGAPFDYHLHIQVRAESGGSRLSFSLTIQPRMPVIVWVVIALSVWPGVWLAHSMLLTYFESYPKSLGVTCAWYLPLTVLPVPWMWLKMLRNSRAAASAHAAELAELIRAELSRPATPRTS
ncbi:MAG: hypothetical protein HBSAPP03_25260 [Phycisphaerae bacterium]|nr:MAG: hypothetical protein HBSAPP03_25260 [Phycisphaerae bacterium]